MEVSRIYLDRPWVALGAIVVLAVLVRVLHLMAGGHYFILSPDSYYFHALAEGVMAGEDVTALHSGLVYPLVALADVTSLHFASHALPVMLGVIGALALFWFGNSVYSPRSGLWLALAWALLPHSALITMAGYLDRDGLTVLLLLAGVLIFYFFKDRSWILAGILTACIAQILYWEWEYIGRWILVVSVGGGMVGLVFLRSWRAIPWKPFLLLVALTLVAELVTEDVGANIARTTDVASFNTGRSREIDELRCLRAEDLLVFYGFFVGPMIVGAVNAVKRRNPADLFILGWFVVLLVASMISVRCLVYAVPAACILTGRGCHVFYRRLSKDMRDILAPVQLKRAAVAILGLSTIVLVGSSMVQGYKIADFQMMAPDDDWVEALHYLRDDTPEDSVVLNFWHYGYWVMDIAERQAVATGGPRLAHEVEAIYADPAKTRPVMDRWGASHFIFPLEHLDVNTLDMSDIKVAFVNDSVGIVERVYEESVVCTVCE